MIQDMDTESNHQSERTRVTLIDEITFLSNFSIFCNSTFGNHCEFIMLIYTEEALDKLKELITILLSLQGKLESANNKILDQVRQLNQKYGQLESENSIVNHCYRKDWLIWKDSAVETPSILEESVLAVYRIANWKTKG